MTGLFFSVFAASPPAVDADAVPAVMMWGYIGELIFNMLILVETGNDVFVTLGGKGRRHMFQLKSAFFAIC